jgi:hypothetical protein
MRCLLLCMSSVVGSDAHRTTLHHEIFGYHLLFGAPLVFVTPNVAENKSPIMRLLYEDAPVGEWCVLRDEGAPQMPSVSEMLRRVSRDPVSQAMFFRMMILLFLKHVLGVDAGVLHMDGVASSTRPSVVGSVVAYHGPVETQGRGGLHPHTQVWLLTPFGSSLLAELRSGSASAELLQRLK